MKVVIADNKTPWTDKTLARLVRSALRVVGHKVLQPLVAVSAFEADGSHPIVSGGGSDKQLSLGVGIPAPTPLRQITNQARRRSQLDPSTALVVMQELTKLVHGPIALRARSYPKAAPAVEARAKPRERKRFDPTPVGRAREQVAKAEARVKKYQSLLERAERDLRKRQGVLKRMEQRFAPKCYGPSFTLG